LSVSPESGKRHSVIEFQGGNFTPGELVTVTYKRVLTSNTATPSPKGKTKVNRSITVLCTATADAGGGFTCSGEIPGWRRSGKKGQHTIVASQSSGPQATGYFTVVRGHIR
jgi:hypothetical protein